MIVVLSWPYADLVWLWFLKSNYGVFTWTSPSFQAAMGQWASQICLKQTTTDASGCIINPRTHHRPKTQIVCTTGISWDKFRTLLQENTLVLLHRLQRNPIHWSIFFDTPDIPYQLSHRLRPDRPKSCMVLHCVILIVQKFCWNPETANDLSDTMGGIPPFYCNFHGEILKITVIINFRGTLFSDNRRSRLSKFFHKTRTSHLVFPRGLVKLPWCPSPAVLGSVSLWCHLTSPQQLRGPPKTGDSPFRKRLGMFWAQQPRLRHPRPQRTTPNE